MRRPYVGQHQIQRGPRQDQIPWQDGETSFNLVLDHSDMIPFDQVLTLRIGYIHPSKYAYVNGHGFNFV